MLLENKIFLKNGNQEGLPLGLGDTVVLELFVYKVYLPSKNVGVVHIKCNS